MFFDEGRFEKVWIVKKWGVRSWEVKGRDLDLGLWVGCMEQ